jgi:predicted NBD/HSP70 family sugar kinase
MQNLALSDKQAASKRTPRHINRNLIFNLIRATQPVSRAELSRHTGLRRSTVSIIVEDLISKSWITEGARGYLPRGRHPTMIGLNNRRGVVGLDIHPSEMTIAISDLSGSIVAQNVFALPADSSKALAAVLAGVRRVLAENKTTHFDGIGICPGRVDRDLQKFIFAPRLHWPIAGLKSRIQGATGLRVEMDNVANACALAEVWFGDSDGAHDLIVVNVSEGIATGIFANGKILRGDNGMAGEFGHVQICSEGGVLCECGNYGCWETLASNTAALRYFRESGDSKTKPNFERLLKLALSGDKAAVGALTKMATYLGRGIRMLVSGLDPKEVVVVGQVTTAWHLLEPVIDTELRQSSLPRSPILRRSNHGGIARLRGAVALILSNVSA